MLKTSSLTLAAVTAAALALPAISPGSAAPLVPTKQTCTTLNCSAIVLPAAINSHLGQHANPWVAQFLGQTASCMRFHVTAQSSNLAMSVVAPDGQVFTNDTGNVAPCPTCPKVVVATGKNGFYTVVVNSSNGAPVEATFTLRVGLYNTANAPNCNGPTTGK